jgi:3'(2'), 5'-bisphosphate nucleotidase
MSTYRWVALVTCALAFSSLARAGQACDDACKFAAVDAYLSALLTHDASRIPLAPQVRRIENNRLNADGDAALRKDLETSAKYRVIRGLRDMSRYVAGDEVFVIYTVDAGVAGLGQLASGRTFERFRVVDGLISQIEIVVYTSAGRVQQPAWLQP